MADAPQPFVVEWGKIAVQLLAIGGLVLLAALGRVSGDSVLLMLGVLSGAVMQNGRLASRGERPVPLISPRGSRRDPRGDPPDDE